MESLGSFAKIKEKFYFTAMALEVLSLIVSERVRKKIDQKNVKKKIAAPLCRQMEKDMMGSMKGAVVLN